MEFKMKNSKFWVVLLAIISFIIASLLKGSWLFYLFLGIGLLILIVYCMLFSSSQSQKENSEEQSNPEDRAKENAKDTTL